MQAIGYIPRKTERLALTFKTHNFSFILSGAGDYLFGNRTIEINSPCVITQSPMRPVNYGPHGVWEEFYLMYSAQAYETLVKRRLFDPQRPIWRINSSGVLYDLMRQLTRLLNVVNEPFVIDKIDVVCELMILESLSLRSSSGQSREERIVRELEGQLRKNPLDDYDFDEYARNNGMHPATFRRHWARYCPVPPDRLLMQLRMSEACRLLAETTDTISQIAYAVRFEDPLYFSRRFRKEFGCTASHYRVASAGPMTRLT